MEKNRKKRIIEKIKKTKSLLSEVNDDINSESMKLSKKNSIGKINQAKLLLSEINDDVNSESYS